MRNMKRNKRTFYYALYTDRKEVVDEDGFYTGEYEVGYTNPIEMKASISASTGSSTVEQFGNLTDYDKVIIVDDMNCPIDENSIIWLGINPIENVGLANNYIVKKKAESLNFISYAIKKVDVKASN